MSSLLEASLELEHSIRMSHSSFISLIPNRPTYYLSFMFTKCISELAWISHLFDMKIYLKDSKMTKRLQIIASLRLTQSP